VTTYQEELCSVGLVCGRQGFSSMPRKTGVHTAPCLIMEYPLRQRANDLFVQVVRFWVATLRNDVVGLQRFGLPCCLHLEGVSLLPFPVSYCKMLLLCKLSPQQHPEIVSSNTRVSCMIGSIFNICLSLSLSSKGLLP
jgi:hypothetical protein